MFPNITLKTVQDRIRDFTASLTDTAAYQKSLLDKLKTIENRMLLWYDVFRKRNFYCVTVFSENVMLKINLSF